MTRSYLVLLPILLLVISLQPSGAKPVDLEEFRCDGGWCEDGQDHILDCRDGICSGSYSPGDFPTLLPAYDSGEWLDDDRYVLGLTLNGTSYAYPVSIMNFYETVSDTINDLPILVSYCPLCGSGLIYQRILDGQEIELLNSGEIWKRDLVMYDTATGSRWSQIAAKALTGDLYGKRLTTIPSSLMPFGDWIGEHPNTKVMQRPLDDQGDPIYRFDRDNFYAHERVHGVIVNDQPIAFGHQQMRQVKVANLVVEGTEIVAALAADGVYVYESEGKVFSPVEDDAKLMVSEGRTYNILTGKSATGSNLTLIPGHSMFAFAWDNFHPDSLYFEKDQLVSDQGGLSVHLTIILVPVVLHWLIRRK